METNRGGHDVLQTIRMVPPSEWGVMRWDKIPRGIFRTTFSHPRGLWESSGVFWLMPIGSAGIWG